VTTLKNGVMAVIRFVPVSAARLKVLQNLNVVLFSFCCQQNWGYAQR
jgi:hypothetical protein